MAKNKLKKVANESLAKSLEKRKAKKPPEFKKSMNMKGDSQKNLKGK